MGIFSQDKTTTNQTAFNEQTAVSNRDLSGTQLTAGAGANVSTRENTGGIQLNTGGSQGNYTITTLDGAALNAAATTINHAIDANTASTQSNLAGFQNALSVVAEHQQSAADLASGQQKSTLGQVGITPQTIGVVAAVIGAVVIFAIWRRH